MVAFKKNLRNEIVKSRKIYFWDLGIRNAIIKNFNPLDLRDDVGALWENFCISEKMKHNKNNSLALNTYFWRTYSKKEIDYIEEESGKLSAFEFKWGKGRKTSAKLFLESYPNSSFKEITPQNFFEWIE